MQFNNISTEDDFRKNQIRMEVVWEKDDIDRFSEFFGRPMTEVVGLIDDGGEAVGAVASSPDLPSGPALTDGDPGNTVLKAVVETCGGRVTFPNSLIRDPAENIEFRFEGDHTTVVVSRGGSPDHLPQVTSTWTPDDVDIWILRNGDPCIHGPGLKRCGHPDCTGTIDYIKGRFD